MAHTLADLVAGAAPMSARRAAAVMVPIAAEAAHLQANGRELEDLRSSEVVLHARGDVELTAGDAGRSAAGEDALQSEGSSAGAALGRWYFELLVGRPPLDRTDAFEPTLTDALSPSTCSLLARSIADHPAQWPTVESWAEHFEQLAGALAPPEPPAHRRVRRRRSVLVAAGIILLAAVTLAVLAAAPRWWDDATSDEGAADPVAGFLQPRFDSS